jgi:uncharacterized protein YuzE
MVKQSIMPSLIEPLKRRNMKIKYFSDTDTALMELNNRPIDATLEVSENIYIDIDKDGKVVNITIEHAKENTKLPEFSYQEVSEMAKSA